MVQVTTTFVGASATDVEASVATPIEQKVNGVEKGIYMKSTNANDGTLTLRVSFEVGSNLDMDNVLAQNRVSEATPMLPQSVKNYGVAVKKALPFPLLIISVKSPKGTYDNNFLSNYATININDEIARIPGVGQINLFGGSDYAMRVWLRPDRIAKLAITVPDIVNAINQQNQILPAGQIGGPPAVPGTQYTYTVKTQGRLLNEEEFGNIVVRSNPDGSQVFLKDVARLELGTMLYNAIGRHDSGPGRRDRRLPDPRHERAPGGRQHQEGDGRPEAALPPRHGLPDLPRHHAAGEGGDQRDRPYPLRGGGARDPRGLRVPAELAVATLIPLVTVPVSLIGAFIFFPLLGFSINVLSLLGLVLAIGIVVDDAIVVVEAVMHHIEHGMQLRRRRRSRPWRRCRAPWWRSASSSPRCSCRWASWGASPGCSTSSSPSRSRSRCCSR